ncbi:NINE protein [uncultured Bifidobacterium sp.]|uniref:NINE protein n=1 Tax=uncultured Bifidobacterium sp. TaxID=165187 RepID=UPI002587072A|nr:NINE protein [uncultured Bifidobacterium sp.]
MTQQEIPTNPQEDARDAQTSSVDDAPTVTVEETDVTNPVTGDAVGETDVFVEPSTDTDGTDNAGGTDSAARSTDETVTEVFSTGQPTTQPSAAPFTTTVESTGNPYMATATSSPYGHGQQYAPDHTFGNAGAQQYAAAAQAAPTYADGGATNAAQPQQQPTCTPPMQPQAYATPAPTYYIARNKILAGVLALFFGMFGIHNFYLGYTGRAVAQLLLSLLGWVVFGLGPLAALVWSWVEAVRILTSDYGTPEHRDARGVELMD